MARRLLLTLDMFLSLTSLTAALILWNAAATAPVRTTAQASPPHTVNKLEGRVVAHADLDGDGTQELFVSLPSSCDDDGRCLWTVVRVRSEGGYRTLLPPTRMWDLSASAVAPGQDWPDLVEARRQGEAMDDITLVRWRFDGSEYRRVDGSEETLPATPTWISDAHPPRTGCAPA